MKAVATRLRWLVALGLLCACGSSASASIESVASGNWSCRVGASSQGLAFDARVGVSASHTFTIQVSSTLPPLQEHLTGTWKRSGTTVHVVLRGTQVQSLTYLGVQLHTTEIAMRSDDNESHFAVKWKGDTHVVFQQTDAVNDRWRADCTKTS